jgi:peroxiredoxin
MVNMTDGSRETVDTASAFITDSGYTFPVLYDTELSAAMAYGIRSLPATYFIDAEGFAVTYGVGAMNLEVLEFILSMILPS